jgi:hypothetical protein
MLLSRGFIVKTALSNYFGPGKDRLYCQLRVRRPYSDPNDRYILDTGATEQVYALLATQSYAITQILATADGHMFEISRFDEDDIAALQANEYNAGIAFSTAILAALTFLLAFAFASSRYPDGARALLGIATLTSTVSLIVYANASGEVGRLRSKNFDQFMQWGNLLSEYGGVIPFLLTIPATFTNVTDNKAVAWSMGALFSVALLLYEISDFSMTSRFPRTAIYRWPAYLTAAIPLLGVPASGSTWLGWAWMVGTTGLLTLRTVVALPSHVREVPRSHD